jgi:hypothetical protein
MRIPTPSAYVQHDRRRAQQKNRDEKKALAKQQKVQSFERPKVSYLFDHVRVDWKDGRTEWYFTL